MPKEDTPLYDIARHTYAQRVMAHHHQQQRPSALQDAILKWCAILLLIAMSTWVPMLLVVAAALAALWPAPPASSPKKPRHPLDFAAGEAEEVPSFDMHLQDVAHRLAYMQH